MEDAKRQSQVTEKETKRELIKTEIVDVKHCCVEVMSCITLLEQDVEKYRDNAEEKHDFLFFLKVMLSEKQSKIKSKWRRLRFFLRQKVFDIKIFI